MFKRILYFEILPYLSHKNAIVICGMRQVGKTTLLKMLFDAVDSVKLWFDFDNPLDLLPFENIDYNQIYANLVRQANPDKGEKLTVFIDEIQNFPEITHIIKYLIDHYQVKFIVTGSSNYYLRNLFPESLSGRKFLYTLHPLSFTEFLCFNGYLSEDELLIDFRNALCKEPDRYEFEKRNPLYDNYVEFGGFPEVALTKDSRTKILIIRNIFASFFEKDIKLFTELKDIRELRDLILLLAPRNGNIMDVSKLASELGINRVKTYSYLEFLRGIFFLKLIPKFSGSIDKSVASGRKIYFSDTGILNVISKVTEGQLFETALCNQLSQYGDLTYYNKRNTAEIDFILNKEIAFEAKIKAGTNDVSRLKKMSTALGIADYYVASRKYSNISGVIYPHFF